MLESNIYSDFFMKSEMFFTLQEKKNKIKKLGQSYPFQCPKFVQVESHIPDLHIGSRI